MSNARLPLSLTAASTRFLHTRQVNHTFNSISHNTNFIICTATTRTHCQQTAAPATGTLSCHSLTFSLFFSLPLHLNKSPWRQVYNSLNISGARFSFDYKYILLASLFGLRLRFPSQEAVGKCSLEGGRCLAPLPGRR